MPLKRTRNGGNNLMKEKLSREMRQSRLTLFIQQFEKEAQERMNELDAKLENMLTTVDKVFKVEVMKMPPSLQKTLIGELISEEVSASDVSIAMKNESLEMPQPLRRVHSKRVKSTDSSPGQPSPAQRSSSKTSKGGKGTKRTRTLVGSNSTGNLTGASAPVKRTQSRVTRTNEQTRSTKPKLRSVVSAGDLHCSMVGSAAHITVTTALGQTVCFSEETKDEINLDLLDDVAWCQIQKLTTVNMKRKISPGGSALLFPEGSAGVQVAAGVTESGRTEKEIPARHPSIVPSETVEPERSAERRADLFLPE